MQQEQAAEKKETDFVHAQGKVSIALVLLTTAHKQSHDHSRSQGPSHTGFYAGVAVSAKDSHVPCSN